MTAPSEKLKALQADDGPENVVLTGECPFILFDALPQIVAVIESAERETGMEDDTEEARMRQVPRLRAALVALNEQLGGDVT